MIRHFTAKHGAAVNQGNIHVDRKRELDGALVNMVVKDSQPFSIVDDCGFKELVALLDPRYTIQSTPTDEQPSTSAQPAPASVDNPSSTGLNLWETLDRDASEARTARNATADATVEVQRYMTDPPLERSKDPLAYWVDHQNVYPNLFKLAKQFLCMPASSVPSERVFSKCGEIVSKKRNRLNPKTVEKIMFLIKNL
ncbi:hypothetical protein JOQ06_021214 [Pogonophryne albipinna]|uniref:HAT C-terminal dimerisation domain-containing protein n=1 Tax=Pogonophryne albipinna TaxID=1090488 RepID=A0AAD6BQU0_9TELE|nr:hypothetical protein JOQ06_021214 [Pogonophryne albipinna]